MSSSFRSWLATVAAIILSTVIAAHPARADSYQITIVDISQTETFVGIDDRGDFVFNSSSNPGRCGEEAFNPCFGVFLIGQSPYFTTAAPVLDYDNGTKCIVALDASFAPATTAGGICNNGHEIFSTFVNGSDVYAGPDTSDQIYGGTLDGGDINANGDAVFVDEFHNALIFAQDLTTTTPEPSSLLLFGTGCLTMTGTLRRYRRAR